MAVAAGISTDAVRERRSFRTALLASLVGVQVAWIVFLFWVVFKFLLWA